MTEEKCMLPADHHEKVAIVLGAGFSQNFGIPGTAYITNDIHDALCSFSEMYENLRNRLEVRFKGYNFETLMAALESCMEYGNLSLFPKTVPYETVLPAISYLLDGLTAQGAKEMYEVAITRIVKAVDIDFKKCAPVDSVSRATDFFNALRQLGRLEIATLNYDNCVEGFVFDAVDGFAFQGNSYTANFDHNLFLNVVGQPRIGHMHGSIYYGIMEATGEFVKTKAIQQGAMGWKFHDDGTLWTKMVTGRNKLGKFRLHPYNAYFAWFADTLVRSSKVVIVGYGVGDVHISAWLLNALRLTHPAPRRLVIIDYFEDFSDPNLEKLQNLFMYGSGINYSSEVQNAMKTLSFDNDIAVLKNAMVIRSGMPNQSQLRKMLDFLGR